MPRVGCDGLNPWADAAFPQLLGSFPLALDAADADPKLMEVCGKGAVRGLLGVSGSRGFWGRGGCGIAGSGALPMA